MIRRRICRVGASVGVAASIAILLSLTFAMAVMAASPSPSGEIGGDPQGPGLMGDPAFAILAVIAIGLIATVATLAYVKLTGGRRR